MIAISGIIIDPANKIVFEWNSENRTYRFNHQTLEAQAKLGIEIPNFLRPQYHEKSKVMAPLNKHVSQTDFDLFIKAFTEHYFTIELEKKGYRIQQQNPPPGAQKV